MASIDNILAEYKHDIQKIRQPINYCQACLGEKIVEPNDYILTCSICESSIHKSHYASQIVGKGVNQSHLFAGNLQDWKCQRCRYLIDKKFQINVKCDFCPYERGIMKRVYIEYSKDHRKQIWIHPQCTTWCHPIIYMKSKKRTHYFRDTIETPTTKFWLRIDNQPTSKCQHCNDSYGYKIKCVYYSCNKYFHIPCAKKYGMIRDLETMRFENSDDYCPVYCLQHLQAYVCDFSNRVALYTKKKQPAQKIMHFTKLHNAYQIQLKNLHAFAKKFRQQQQLRKNQTSRYSFNGGMNAEDSSYSLQISQQKQQQDDGAMISSSSDSSAQYSVNQHILMFLDGKYKLQDIDVIAAGKQKADQQKKQQSKQQLNYIKMISHQTKDRGNHYDKKEEIPIFHAHPSKDPTFQPNLQNHQIDEQIESKQSNMEQQKQVENDMNIEQNDKKMDIQQQPQQSSVQSSYLQQLNLNQQQQLTPQIKQVESLNPRQANLQEQKQKQQNLKEGYGSSPVISEQLEESEYIVDKNEEIQDQQ